ncbi:hypothetical protein OWV82_013977 [Melia azedarach]|uniref:Uncharacterized protein n=1 Tax=Melia azedarach TaxID=155640 RepID=A0ACC1XW43_MELAZ|nr:hypothetical protein OWV82_013977 [Melia azedarach]
MSSIGASSAAVYVKRKHYEEKLKRLEEERIKRGENNNNKNYEDGSSAFRKRNTKVHPGNFPGTESSQRQGERING